jgi:hypothetical protein
MDHKSLIEKCDTNEGEKTNLGKEWGPILVYTINNIVTVNTKLYFPHETILGAYTVH